MRLSFAGYGSAFYSLIDACQNVTVVLCDLDLPDGSGLGLIRALRAKQSQLPVLAMTELADYAFFSLAARQAGAAAMLAKPFSEQALVLALKPWMASLDLQSAAP